MNRTILYVSENLVQSTPVYRKVNANFAADITALAN